MKLVCFGDSWTAGHGVEDDIRYKEDPGTNNFIVNFRNANSWPRWLSDKLNCPFVNMGGCGHGIFDLIHYVNESVELEMLTKEDIIIVQFTYPHRYRDKKPENNPIEVYKQLETLLRPYKHFYFNGFYPLFKDELNIPNTLPDYFINPDGTLADFLKSYEIEHDEGVWEYGSRSIWNDEQNFWEGDYHPNL